MSTDSKPESQAEKEDDFEPGTAFLSAPRLIFVCGKEWVDNEETIRNYTIRTLRKCRIAESLWYTE